MIKMEKEKYKDLVFEAQIVSKMSKKTAKQHVDEVSRGRAMQAEIKRERSLGRIETKQISELDIFSNDG